MRFLPLLWAQLFRKKTRTVLTLLSVLTRLRAKNTDALIRAVADVLQENGITLMDSTVLLRELVAGAGVLSATKPSSDMRADFEFGYRVADAIETSPLASARL